MLLLWILPLAASFLLPATGEVVADFSTCSGYFLDGKPPALNLALNPMNLVPICQRYRNAYRFATLYETHRRIPIFSAYLYKPGSGTRITTWMIEPQLVQHSLSKTMQPEYIFKKKHHDLGDNQAVSADYTGSTYDRGHLAPVCHQPDQHSREATFTLTNVVPQFRQLNSGAWSVAEAQMAVNMTGCNGNYTIVGVVPGNNYLNVNRVNIPSHIWAAACCVLPNNQRKSWGIMAQNSQNVVDSLTLQGLENQLSKLYGVTVDLFNSAC